MKECFGQYGKIDERVCKVCSVRRYCERYVLAESGCPEFGSYDYKDETCRLCTSVYYVECRSGEESGTSGSVKAISKKKKGVRQWMDECLEKGIFEDDFKKQALEKWGRKLSLREHSRYREQKFGWVVKCETVDGRKFYKLEKKGEVNNEQD